MNTTDGSSGAENPFEKFLLSEYANLAQAFFSAGTSLTQFFQYYLLALGVPLTAAGIAVKVSGETLDLSKLANAPIAPLLAVVFLVIGIVGLCMAIYIINIRMDAILYARAVNGVRRYFYLRFSPEQPSEYRVLPIEISRPPYAEPWPFFLPVVAAFALLDSTYVFLSLLLFFKSLCSASIVALIVGGVHFSAYFSIAKRRDKLMSP